MFLESQLETYKRIANRGAEQFPAVRIGTLNPGTYFGSTVVVMRHREETRDAMARWREEVDETLGPEWWSPNPEESLHITVGNSGPTDTFTEDADKVDRLKQRVWDYLRGQINDWGEVAYDGFRETGDAVIMGVDALLAAGIPDQPLVVNMSTMAERLSPENMGTPWGAHTTLGRFRKEGSLEAGRADALLRLLQEARFPSSRITTVDVAVQENIPGQAYTVDPRERFTFKNGVWHLAE